MDGMKPAEHPDFFKFPAPEGRSRESTIRLDAEGHFHHDGEKVEHAGMASAFHGWIARHPDDGRYVLTNGYDWTYFVVDDAPYFVKSVRIERERVVLALTDGSEEAWDPTTTRIGDGGALYASVKRDAKGGPFDAKFTRHAQTELAPVLVDEGGRVRVRIGDRVVDIGRA